MKSVEEIKEDLAHSIRESLTKDVIGKPSSVEQVKKNLDAVFATMHDIEILDVKTTDKAIVYTVKQLLIVWTISWSL